MGWGPHKRESGHRSPYKRNTKRMIEGKWGHSAPQKGGWPFSSSRRKERELQSWRGMEPFCRLEKEDVAIYALQRKLKSYDGEEVVVIQRLRW